MGTHAHDVNHCLACLGGGVALKCGSLNPIQVRILLLKVVERVGQVTASGCGECNHGLALEVILFDKGVDDIGRIVTPDRESYVNHIVALKVLGALLEFGAERFVGHLLEGAGLAVTQIHIFGRVRLCSFNLEQVCSGGCCQVL